VRHADHTLTLPIGALARPRGIRTPGDAGAPATATEVFELVYRQIRAFADARDVEDLAQTAVEHVLRALPSFEGRSQLSTWTFRICYLTVRKHDRWHRRWLRRLMLTKDGELPESPSDAEQVEDGLHQRERLTRLRAAMERLSAKRRAVIVLHDIEGHSVEDIAGMVEASVAAVRSRLRDGRRELARLLADDPWFGDEACKAAKRGKREENEP
jgi:RNA polymerase sigma-70 factor (ECF subfamily)